jgi:hypothetical protein
MRVRSFEAVVRVWVLLTMSGLVACEDQQSSTATQGAAPVGDVGIALVLADGSEVKSTTKSSAMDSCEREPYRWPIAPQSAP